MCVFGLSDEFWGGGQAGVQEVRGEKQASGGQPDFCFDVFDHSTISTSAAVFAGPTSCRLPAWQLFRQGAGAGQPQGSSRGQHGGQAGGRIPGVCLGV